MVCLRHNLEGIVLEAFRRKMERILSVRSFINPLVKEDIFVHLGLAFRCHRSCDVNEGISFWVPDGGIG